MLKILYILAAICILGVIVVVHEFGHYLVGRLCGIGVVEFAVGMGPKLFGWKRKGIQYSVRLIPLAIRCKNATFETLTIPQKGTYSTRTIDGMWVIVPNLKQNKALLREFLGLKEE